MSPRPALRRPLRVATYNVHRCEGLDRRTDPLRIARVLVTLDADVIALQEVDTRLRATPARSHLDFLADAAGLTVFPGPTVALPGGWYGIAVLARVPVLAVRRIDLSHPGREPRCALDLDVDHDGLPVRVVAAHLGLDGGERSRQVQVLLDRIPDDASPCVLLGDFNEWFRSSANLRRLDARLGRSAPVPTFPARFPFLALDRVWARPHGALREVRAHRSPLAQAASDHLPLQAVIDFG